MKGAAWLSVCLLAFLFIVTGCETKEGAIAREGQQVPVFREFKGQQGPFPDRGFFVVQRQDAWRALWGNTAAPEVDFTNNSVLVALMGRQPTAGYTISINDVRATGERIVAYVDEDRPDPGETVAQVVTYPYHMAVVPKVTQNVAFNVEGATMPVLALQDQYTGQQSLVVAPQTQVIRDQTAWQRFWTASFGPNTTPPAVDFSRNMAVAVLAGQRQTAGYAVNISSIEQSGDRLLVNYRLVTPQPGEPVAQVQTSPYAIAIVQTSNMPIAFRSVTPVTIAAAPLTIAPATTAP